MLRQRVITALIMAGLFLAAVAFLSLAWLALLFGVLICLGAGSGLACAGWESTPARVLYVARARTGYGCSLPLLSPG